MTNNLYTFGKITKFWFITFLGIRIFKYIKPYVVIEHQMFVIFSREIAAGIFFYEKTLLYKMPRSIVI